MAKFTHDMIIIGGGAAGLTCASGSAQLGLKTALIERRRLGGDCLFHGCVPSKTLLKSAHVLRDARNAAAYGLPEMKAPKPDAHAVMARVSSVIEAIQHHDSPERFRSLGAEVIFDSPRFVSPHEVRLEGGETLSAKKIVLATGSSPAILPIPGIEEAGYITNLDVFDLNAFPEHLIVIGAGPIGVELSQAFVRFGMRVTIITNAGQILEREDPDMAQIVHEQLEGEGVEYVFNAAIKRITAENGKKTVHYDSDAGETALEGDEILMAAGRRGNTDDLDLEKAGVLVEGSFVRVDEKLRTSAPHIMAVGDVNGKFLFTHVAGAEGMIVIKRSVLGLPAKMDYTYVPWCTYTDPEIASVGYNEVRAKEAGIEYTTIETRMKDVDRANAEGSTDGKIKVLLDSKDRVIGTQIVGPAAGELIGPSIFAVRKRYKMMELMSPIFPYPTLTEIYKKTGGTFYAPRFFNDRTRKWLKRIYGYGKSGTPKIVDEAKKVAK